MRRSPASISGSLIADALRCEPERAAPLAQLVHEKTAAIRFSPSSSFLRSPKRGCSPSIMRLRRWSWDLDRIHAKGYTDNVVDLMVGKLTRLPAETRKALQQFACLGNVADDRNASRSSSGPRRMQVHAALWQAVRLGVGRAPAGRLPVHPRPGAGGRLFADPGEPRALRRISGLAGCSRRRRLPRSGRRRSSRSSISSTAAPP